MNVVIIRPDCLLKNYYHFCHIFSPHCQMWISVDLAKYWVSLVCKYSTSNDCSLATTPGAAACAHRSPMLRIYGSFEPHDRLSCLLSRQKSGAPLLVTCCSQLRGD